MTFSERLLNLRKERNLLQRDICSKLGILQPSYQRYESGRIPSADKLIALADYFDVSIDYLLCRTDNPEVNR